MPTFDELNTKLSYDASTGEIIWLKSGRRAGSVWPNGYVIVTFAGRNYRGHRLAWLLHYGQWPESDVDHIDLNRTNNRISNLRLTTASQNIANTVARSSNKSGFKGVSWHRGSGKWQASIMVNRKSMGLGLFDDPAEAGKAYERAAVRYFGEFARAA